MQLLTLASRTETQRLIKCKPARVYIDGSRRRDLQVLLWELLSAPRFGRARLTLQPSQLSPVRGRIEDLPSLPDIGSQVLIKPVPNFGSEEFRGIVTRYIVEVGQEERLVAEVQHRLAHILRRTIHSRIQLKEGQPVEVESSKVRFNANRDTLASESLVDLDGRLSRVFDAEPAGRRWSVADAIAYLIATGVPEKVQVPSTGELEDLAGSIDLGAIDITGLTAAEAMTRVARSSGLDIRASRDCCGLVVYRPGRQGRRTSVRLQATGELLSLTDSNLWRGEIKISRRPSRRAVLALGEKKRYESTFELQTGWDPALQTSRWRDFIRSESDNWPAVADVYRKWVLNEDGHYNTQPWSLSTYDFAAINSQDFLLQEARKFSPCISTDSYGQNLGIVVEVRYGYDETWNRWTGPVWVSSDRCEVYLGGDALPADYFQAAATSQVQLRVTATVEADTRLVAEIAGDGGLPREVVDFSAHAKWRKVHEGSIFFNQEGIGEPAEQDDTEVLRNLARRYSEVVSTAVEGELHLGWVDTSYHIGDIVERIDGKDIELPSNPYSRPHVTSVQHDFINQSTRLTING